MTRRYRRVAALLVLAAFSGYCAEGVLAAFCAPGSPQHGEPAVHASHGPAGSAHADAGATHEHGHGHGGGSHGHAAAADGHATATHEHGGGSHEHATAAHGHGYAAQGGPAAHESPVPAGGPHHSHCPFGMAGGVSCTAISLPGHGVAVVPLPASSERNVVPPQFNIPLLLDRSLYHPPRA
jgi:hypothetical protein